MKTSDILKDLFESRESAEHSELYDVLQQLVNSDDNIDLKTEIKHPERLSVLKLLGMQMKDFKLKRSSETISKYLEFLFRFYFSKDRKSRREIIESIKSLAIQQSEENEEKTNADLISKIRR